MKHYENVKEFGIDLSRTYLTKFSLKLNNNIINSSFTFITTTFRKTASLNRQIKMRVIVKVTASTSEQQPVVGNIVGALYHKL